MEIHRFKHALLALALSMGLFCPARGENISQSQNVSSAAGNVVFEVTAPSSGTYGHSNYSFSQTWLSFADVPFPVSMNATYFKITLAVTANTGAARTATFSCTLNGNPATFTVNQAAGGGGGTPVSVITLTKSVSAAAQTVVCSDSRLADVWSFSNPTDDWVTDWDWDVDDIVLTIDENTGSERSVTLSLYDQSKQFVGTLTLTQAAGRATPIPPPSNFGPGNASEFYISASEKAFVAGVYDLHWSNFAIRSDGYYAYTNPNIVDREKGSGGSDAQDHSWCVAYSYVNAAIWGGWGYLGGYGDDEDLFGDAMIQSGTPATYEASLQFVEGVLLPETSSSRFYETCNSGFAQKLQSYFANADAVLVTQVYFDNYTWYGTKYQVISHGVVCCGYSLDTSKAITDPTCLKGLFIIDSDNDRENSGGRSNAPNTMTYCPVSWDASLNRYNVSNVFGATGYLWNTDYMFDTFFFKCKGAYTLRKSEELPPDPPTYSDSKSVGAEAGSVQFVLALPNSNNYSWNTAEFKFSAPWLTLAQPPSRNNHTVYLTFNYQANTGTAVREAVFTATIDNTVVTLTVSQAGVTVPVPSPIQPSTGTDTSATEARTHGFGTVGEAVGRIEASPLGIPTQKRTYNVVVCDALGKPVGTLSVSVGKASNSGQCSVKATFIGLDGKKKSSNSVKVSALQSGATHVTLFVKDYGTLELALGSDSVAGTLGKYNVLPARVGGSLGTSRSSFNLENFNWTGSTKLLDAYLPTAEVFTSGNRWVFDKAAVVKYKQGVLDQVAYEKGLSSGKTNKSGLKLTYNARTGTFKGYFTVYSEDSSGQTAKLKKTRVTVTGVVADGYGYGQAVIRNGGTFSVAISPVR